MSYSDLLESEGIKSQYLVIMRPRRLIDGDWTVVTGTVYTTPFTLGQITAVLSNGEALAEASDTSVGSDEFYYDVDNGLLYLDIGSDPTDDQIIVTYELYFGTFDAHWYRSPLDDTSRVVYYEPLITRSPRITNSTSDVLFGFLPTFTGSVTISNATRFLQEHVYASSFNFADILIYHYLDELTTDNIKLVLKGYCKQIKADDNDVSFSILDATSFFEREYRHEGLIDDNQFYTFANFPTLDPAYDGRPIRQVFGVVDGFVPVNIEYVVDGGVGDNRTWVCLHGYQNLGTMTTTVKASPASTTTRTYLTDVTGFRVGDSWWNKNVSTKYGKISTVGADYIEHDDIGVANASGNIIERSFVGIVYLKKDGILYELWYGRDYQEYTESGNNVAGFILDAALTGVSDELSPADQFYCRVYGHKNTTELGGNPFGSDSSTTGNLTNGIVILWHLLKDRLGLSESDLNTTSFQALEASVTDELGFAIPKTTSNDFPNFKDLIIDICQSLLLKFFLDFDNTWKISQTMPLGTADKTIEDDEILADSFEYEFSYQDIVSFVILEYAFREFSELGEPTESSSTVSSRSNTALYLHNTAKQKTFQSLHFIEAEASVLADRLKFYFGDRIGKCTIDTKNRFFDTQLDHVIEINRDRMPGSAFVSGTNISRDFAVVSTEKSLTSISIELDDQKGIEDNSGDW